VGSTATDWVGRSGVTALINGNYVVSSVDWDNGSATNAGAMTWCSGTTGCTGGVSANNSLVGSTANDRVGYFGVTALTNGNFVVSSPSWGNGAATDAGAVTWCSGTSGCTGAVSASNSLVGSTANDQVGYYGVTVLTNGNYVVSSFYWNNGAATDAGAVTWCSGTSGCTGAVSASNSLVGSTANDQVGYYGVTALTNGSYLVSSTNWDNGSATDAGAVTWCSETSGCTGAVASGNSVLGTTAGGGPSQTVAYDSVNDQLVVGRPADNRVTLFIPTPTMIAFGPTGGFPGTSVTITGTSLAGATAVRFNGASASNFKVLSSTSLTATVPWLATTGPISVTTPGGTAISGTDFMVSYHTIVLPVIRR
jgi:hypothetical protein